MLEVLLDAITQVWERTGLDIDIYTRIGERLASTHNTKDAYKFGVSESLLDKKGGIVADTEQNITYFLIDTKDNKYVGVIRGANQTSANYAYMVARIIGSSLANQAPPPNRKEVFKQLLSGDCSEQKLDIIKDKYRILDLSYYVLCVVTQAKNRSTVLDFLEQMSGANDIAVIMPDNNIAMLKVADTNGDYQSAGEFAEMLRDNIEQDLSVSITVGIGDRAAGLNELHKAYAQGVTAIRFGKLMDNKSKVFSHKDYMLVKLYEELPADRLKWYISSNLDKNAQAILGDRELLETAEQFFNNNLNISEAARVMYMHRNTLIYRLDKIEKTTGLNIRKFSDAIIFRTLITLNKVVGQHQSEDE